MQRFKIAIVSGFPSHVRVGDAVSLSHNGRDKLRVLHWPAGDEHAMFEIHFPEIQFGCSDDKTSVQLWGFFAIDADASLFKHVHLYLE